MLSRTSLLCLSAFAVAAAACGGDGSGERSVSPFDGGPASPKLRTGEWQRTFHHPGSYNYVCTLHPIMKGTVSVG